MSDSKKYDMPFGWSQGESCVVCLHHNHREQVQHAFKLRAHYILPLEAVTGRRYNRIIVFQGFMTPSERDRMDRWVKECLYTSLEVNGEFYVV